MRHAKRTVLTADDVDSALSLRNVEVNYIPMINFQGTSNVVYKPNSYSMSYTDILMTW